MTVLCDSCSPRKQCTADKNRTECRFYQPMTNEEWFCGLSTEEKAEVISRLTTKCSQLINRSISNDFSNDNEVKHDYKRTERKRTAEEVERTSKKAGEKEKC